MLLEDELCRRRQLDSKTLCCDGTCCTIGPCLFVVLGLGGVKRPLIGCAVVARESTGGVHGFSDELGGREGTFRRRQMAAPQQVEQLAQHV